VADWADVEFRQTPGRRRLRDALSLAPDILMLWNFLVSLASGHAMHILSRIAFATPTGIIASTGTFVPGIVMGSLLLALLLRSTPLDRYFSQASASACPPVAQTGSNPSRIAFVVFAFASQPEHLRVQLWIPAWLLLFALIVGTTRWRFEIYLSRLEKSGAFREAVAIVGAQSACDRLAERLAASAHIVGFCEAPLDRTGFLRQDEIEKLQELSTDGRLDTIVLAFEKERTDADIAAIVERLKILPMQVGICDEGERKGSSSAELRLLAGVPIKVLANRPINRRDLLIKTILDVASAAILLVILAPLLAAIALAIAATSKGPVIFRQTRQGWCGSKFTMFKFRTMRDVQHLGDGFTQTKRKDPRCTRVGHVLRSTSMDELPQLWNVLRGDMSFVGPRPHAEMLDETDRAGREIIAEYAHRFRVKPGITGWAQVHGARGAISTIEQLRRRVTLDLFYIEHWSLWLDVKIVAKTPFCLMGKNVF
jgi:exopolysaccharide biosynthesis polyprenyl glycosylphosphotransferase